MAQGTAVAESRKVGDTELVTVGIDVSDRYSHLCILGDDGEILREERVRTTTAALTRALARMPGARVVMEVGPRSPWTFEDANTPAWREAEIPAGNGHADARGLARVYGALALGGELDGVRLLSESAIEQARTLQSEGTDATIGVENRYALGFQLPSPALGDPRPETAFGHSGVGGSQAFADPGAGLGFAYVMNRIRGPGDVRARSLVEAAYGSIEAGA